MSLVQHFATPFQSGRSNIRVWNDIAARSSPGLSIDMVSPEFRGELYNWQLPSISMLWATAAGSIVHRHARSAADEHILVHIQGRGRCRQTHRRRTIELMPGDLSLCSSMETATLETSLHDMIVADIPRAALESRVGDLDALLGCRIASSAPSVTALRQFLVASWRGAIGRNVDQGAEWSRRFETAVTDLVALALCDTPDEQAPDEQVVPYLAIIDAQLHDPTFSVDCLAAQSGVSRRTVQLRLADAGTTLTDLVLERRLLRAASHLTSDTDESVTNIALDCGFNDPAYFTRCFKRRFGVTPSVWRSGRA